MIGACTDTVSLLHALVFGAGEACVSISVPSIIGVLVPFIAIVLTLQWLARRILFGAPDRKVRSPVASFPRTGQVRASDEPSADAKASEAQPRRRGSEMP